MFTILILLNYNVCHLINGYIPLPPIHANIAKYIVSSVNISSEHSTVRLSKDDNFKIYSCLTKTT